MRMSDCSIMREFTLVSCEMSVVSPRLAETPEQPRIALAALMRLMLASANSPAMDHFGSLMSPPVRMTERLGGRSSCSTFPLLVTTVTFSALMCSSTRRAVELVLMKTVSPSSTKRAVWAAMLRFAVMALELMELPKGSMSSTQPWVLRTRPSSVKALRSRLTVREETP